MKKIIFILILLVAINLSAYDFRSGLGITASQERHILGCGVISLTAMYFTDKPVLSASVGLIANCSMEIYDHSVSGVWDYEDLRTGCYCFLGNVAINYVIQIIKKQTKEDHKPKRYDPMFRNDSSKDTIIDLTESELYQKMVKRED